MEVDETPASRRALVFRGTAAQVEAAFHTRIQKYRVNGKLHYANESDPEIPLALASVVHGVVSLHDFHSAPQHVVAPRYTAGNGAHFLEPQDWVTIYDVGPLYNQGLDGTGQSIAVLGRVDVALSDVRTFRTNAGLLANDPVMVVNGADPGFPDCDDEAESALDVEWAGAIAKNATVRFVTTQSSGAGDGVALSAQYAVNHNVAPIISLSYGLCEAAMGSGGNAFWNNTWAQAAAEGISVFVSSGDSGAAGCDSPSQTTASHGKGVNGLCSSPYATCVGGTQFNDTYNPVQYWSSTNGAGQSSALGYIPESVWDESSWSGGLWSGGGGASIVYPKPSWQAAPGVPADGMRDVPDVALHGSIQDAYIIQIQGGTFYVSGTSAATPALASVMALVLENAGSAQGNANPVMYALGNQQYGANGAAVFHDVTLGNNSVPGVTGFNAGVGYDEGTGLGSMDASLFVNHWSDGNQLNFTVTPSVTTLSVAPGGSATMNMTLIAQGGFSAPVTLSASGAPTGMTVQFSSTTPSAGVPVTATISAASSLAAGNYALTIVGSGGGLSRSSFVAVSVAKPSFTLAANATAATVMAGSSVSISLATAVIAGFKSAVTLSASGLPKGVTATLSPVSIASPGGGTSTLKLTAATTAVAGVSTITVKAVGGGITQTQTVSLTVIVPSFTLTAQSSSATANSGGAASFAFTTATVNGFKSALSLSVTGLPKGVTAKFAPASIASPGSGSSTMTLTLASTTIAGTYSLTVTASGGSVSKTQTVSLSVNGPDLAVSLSGAAVSMARNGSIPLTVATTGSNGFAAAVTLSASGLPKGVTATFAPTSIAAPGSGSSTMTLKGSSTATKGTATVTVTASGGNATRTATVAVTVQ
jgi:subtilase family serine protease